MEELYRQAINLIGDISTIKNAIRAISNHEEERMTLKTDHCIGSSYRLANVRPTAYVQFLNGELKDLEKCLKVIESKIKTNIK